TVTAFSQHPLQYQWSLEGVPLPGATNATLSWPNAQTNLIGNYTVTISSALGSVLSLPASLLVLAKPIITTAPQSQTVQAGQKGIFQVAATGFEPLIYRWYLNSRLIRGATGP